MANSTLLVFVAIALFSTVCFGEAPYDIKKAQYLFNLGRDFQGVVLVEPTDAVSNGPYTYVTSKNSHDIAILDASGNLVNRFGSPAQSGAHPINYPSGLAVDNTGRLIICNTNAQRVEIYDVSNSANPTWKDGFKLDNQPAQPAFVAYSYNGGDSLLALVTDTRTNGRLQIYTYPDLTLQYETGSNYKGVALDGSTLWVTTATNMEEYSVDLSPSFSLTLQNTYPLAYPPNQFKYDPVSSTFVYPSGTPTILVSCDTSFTCTPYTISYLSDQLPISGAVSLAVIGSNNYMIVGSSDYTLTYVSNIGQASSQILGVPQGTGLFASPASVTIHPGTGAVAVADQGTPQYQASIQLFDYNANYKATYVASGGEVLAPAGLRFDDGGRLWVANSNQRSFFSLTVDSQFHGRYNATSIPAALGDSSSSLKFVVHCGDYIFASYPNNVDSISFLVRYTIGNPDPDAVVVTGVAGLTCSDSILYVGDRSNYKVYAYTFDNIVTPIDAISLPTYYYPGGLAFQDNLLFVTATYYKDDDYAVWVYKASDLANPFFKFGQAGIGQGKFSPVVNDIAVYKNYIYISDSGNARVQVFCAGYNFEQLTSDSVLGYQLVTTGTMLLNFTGTLFAATPEIIVVNPITNPLPAGMAVTRIGDAVYLTGTVDPTLALSSTPAPFTVQIKDTKGCASPIYNFKAFFMPKPPRIDSFTPTTSDTYPNSEIMTLTGYFPRANYKTLFGNGVTFTITIGGNPCTSPNWSADETTVACTIPAGYGDKNVVSIDVEDTTNAYKESFSKNYYSYNPPVIDNVDKDNQMDPEGNTPIVITGRNFGPLLAPLTVQLEGLTCSTPTRTQAHFTIKCTAPPGVGNNNNLNITVGDAQHGYQTGTKLVAYAPYQFACTQNGTLPVSSVNGGTLIVICGTNFGPAVLEGTATNLGLWSGMRSVRVNNRECFIEQISETEIQCRLPPGTGKFHVKVNLNSFAYTTLPLMIAYPPPTLLSVTPAVGVLPGVTLTIAGSGFGYATPEAPRSVTIGRTGTCTNIKLYGNDLLTCVATGGRGSNQPVYLTVNGQTTDASYTIDYQQQTSVGLNCVPPAGAQDLLDPTICNCFSGYQPAAQQTDCISAQSKKRSNPVSYSCPGQILSGKAAQYPPLRPTVKFARDRVFIEQRSPVVHGRRDSYIYFKVPETQYGHLDAGTLSAESCNFPGEVWTKTTDGLNCEDVWTGEISWIQHDLCGWDLDSAPSSATVVYKTSLVHQYRDIVNSGSTYHQAVHKTSYLLKVSFVKQLHTLVGEFSVVLAENEAEPVGVELMSALLYDPAVQSILFTFRTTVAYPFMVNPDNRVLGVYQPTSGTANITAYAIYSAVQPGDISCASDETHSPCVQEWQAVIDVGANTCVLDGKITFNTSTLLCRDLTDNAECPANGFYQAQFSLATEHMTVCDTEEVDATKDNSVTLTTFVEPALVTVANVFQVGDYIYFQAAVVDNDGTMDEVKLNRVTFGTLDTLYDLDTATLAQGIEFNFTNVLASNSQPIPPGTPANVVFWFRLDRSLQSLTQIDAGFDSVAQILVEATLDISYHGNTKKRSLVIEDRTSVTDSAHIIVKPAYGYDDEINDANKMLEEQAMDEQLFTFGFVSSASTTLTTLTLTLSLLLLLVF